MAKPGASPIRQRGTAQGLAPRARGRVASIQELPRRLISLLKSRHRVDQWSHESFNRLANLLGNPASGNLSEKSDLVPN